MAATGAVISDLVVWANPPLFLTGENGNGQDSDPLLAGTI
jgi:hypothetical protein